MGASSFENWGRGPTAKEAFYTLVERAKYEDGHGGYTGTIAEKHGFVMCGSVKTKGEAMELVGKLFDAEDSRIQDKWGPAGCIKVEDEKDLFVFFGYASS